MLVYITGHTMAVAAGNAVLLALCVIAAWTDIEERKIPNWAVLPAIVIGAALTLAFGLSPLYKIAAFLLLFLLDGIGLKGGDTKITMAAVMLTLDAFWFLGIFILAELLLLVTHFISQKGVCVHGSLSAYGKAYSYPFAPCMLIAAMAAPVAQVIIYA